MGWTNFDNNLPRKVLFGRGRSKQLGALAAERGWRRVFVVSDRGVANAGLLDEVLQPIAAAELLAGSFCDVPPEPPLEVADQIATQLQACQADAVIALGGGSVMDATKVAIACSQLSKSASSLVGIGKIQHRGVPSILIPTTAGTGSEATFVAILTDAKTGNKVGVVDPCLLADIAIIDPALTDRLPGPVTAATGMDAVVHAIEAYIARVATPLAQGLALQAARHLGRSLEVVCSHPTNAAARDDMAIGSHLAGMAFANSSCCAVHAIALPLGGHYPIPHGVITGCFAGEMMRHNAPACADAFALLSSAFGWGSLAHDAFADKLDAVARSIGLFDQLHKTTVPDEALASLAEQTMAIPRLIQPNPQPLDASTVQRILRTVLSR